MAPLTRCVKVFGEEENLEDKDDDGGGEGEGGDSSTRATDRTE